MPKIRPRDDDQEVLEKRRNSNEEKQKKALQESFQMPDNLLQCSKCNTLNQIPEAISSDIFCGSCGRRLISNSRKSEPLSARIFLLGLILGGCGVLYLVGTKEKAVPISLVRDSPEIMPAAKNSDAISDDWSDLGTEVAKPKVHILPRPRTGVLESSNARLETEFRLKASNESDYYVSLNDQRGGLIATYYLRAGELLVAQVPTGSLSLSFAAGRNWLGSEELFADDLVFSEGNRNLEFSRGYVTEVRLILQRNGNFATNQISREEFLNRVHQR